jgi:site-specific DNA-methyltransferase (adenine-specific)
MQDIPDKSIDMILCDLPYGTTACKWDTIIPFEPLWEQYKRIIKDNGAIVLTASQPFTSALVMSNIKMFKYSFVWDKKLATGHLSSKIMPMKRHEDILVFGKGKIVFNPQLTERNEGIRIEKRTEKILGLNDSVYGVHKTTSREYSHRQPTSIIEISNANRKNRLHPTQKPVALFEYLIKTYTNE